MGGRMSLTIRESDGKVHNFYAWTGIENEILHKQEFYDGKYKEAIKNLSKNIKEYSDGENFKNNGVFPTGYGIIVIDLKNKKIHSHQGYNNPGALNIIDFRSPQMYDRQKIPFEHLDFYDENDKFIGSVKDVLGKDLDKDKFIQIAFNKMVGDPDLNYQDKAYDIRFIFLKPRAMKDFEVLHYNFDQGNSLLSLMETLKEEGFNITKEDKEKWEKFQD